jgi:hypothetical protein
MTPKQVERLEKTLGRVAREQGLDQERLRRWVSFLALCGVLQACNKARLISELPARLISAQARDNRIHGPTMVHLWSRFEPALG